MVSNACRQLCAESYRLSAKFEMFTSVRLAQCSARGGVMVLTMGEVKIRCHSARDSAMRLMERP